MNPIYTLLLVALGTIATIGSTLFLHVMLRDYNRLDLNVFPVAWMLLLCISVVFIAYEEIVIGSIVPVLHIAATAYYVGVLISDLIN